MSGVVITAELQAALAAGAAAVLAVLGVVLFRRAAGYGDSRAVNQQLVAVMFWFVSFSWAASALAIVIGLSGDSPDTRATVAATIVWTSAIARTAVIVIAASILVDVARHRRSPTRPASGNVRPLPTDGRTSASAGARHHRPPTSEVTAHD